MIPFALGLVVGLLAAAAVLTAVVRQQLGQIERQLGRLIADLDDQLADAEI